MSTESSPDDSKQPERGRGPGKSFSRGCLVAFVVGFMVLVLLVGAIGVVLFASAFLGVSRGTYLVAGVPLQEVTVSGVSGSPKVVEIPVQGLLLSGGTGLEPDPVLMLNAMLKKARQDKDMSGVILVVNSGGGGVTACDRMHRAVKQYREVTGKPVVALMGDIAASGAYYVSCGADYIIAHPTTITGSIGVLMPLYDASGLLKKVGVSDRTVKSVQFKDMASLTAEKTREQWEREKAILAGIIGQMHERFVRVVAEGRGLDPDVVGKLADGRIYSSMEALENKLIDAVGYGEHAVRKVRELADLPGVHLVRYRRTPSVLEMLLSHQKGLGVGLRFPAGLPVQFQQRPMYLWRLPVVGVPQPLVWPAE